MPELGIAAAPAACLEGKLGIKPQSHIFVASKVPQFDIAGPLPRSRQCRRPSATQV